MRVERIVAENFLSFRHLDVSLQTGTIAVTGENRDAPGARSNGAGKSALVDAISYGLYGQTTRGLSGDDVVHREAMSDCRVEIWLADAPIRGVIRYRKDRQKKNALEIIGPSGPLQMDRMKDAQKQVDLALSMDWATFRQAVLFGQDAVRFLGLSDAEKKEILERILGMDVLDHAAELARKGALEKGDLAEASETNRRCKESEMTGLIGRLEALELLAANKRQARQDMAVELIRQIEEIRERRLKYDSETQAIRASYEKLAQDLEKDILEHSPMLEAGRLTLGRAHETVRHAQKTHMEFSFEHSSLERQIHELDGAIVGLLKLEGQCPTCLQDVPASHVSNVQKVLGESRAPLGRKLEEIKSSVNESKSLLDRSIKNEKSMEDSTRGLESTLSQAVAQLEAAQRDLARVDVDAGREHSLARANEKKIRTELAALQSASDDSEDPELVRTREVLSKGNGELQEWSQKADLLMKESGDYGFWADGFGLRGLRSMLMDGILPYLEDRANFYLSELTGKTFRLAFSSLSTAKADKEPRNVISVGLSASSGGHLYEALSGGERQRMDLAVALALFDLAREHAGKKFDLAVFDEVFERLDDAGCEAVGALLRRHAPRWGTVLVMTHLDSLLSEVPRRVRVVKENGASRIA